MKFSSVTAYGAATGLLPVVKSDDGVAAEGRCTRCGGEGECRRRDGRRCGVRGLLRFGGRLVFACKGAEETWAWCRGDEDRAGGKALAAVVGGCIGWWWWRLLVRDERSRGETGSAGEVDI